MKSTMNIIIVLFSILIGVCLSHDSIFEHTGQSPFSSSHSIFRDASTNKLFLKPRDFNAVGFQQDELAYGKFTDSVNQTGWALLEVHTNPKEDDQSVAEAAGYYEGKVTALRILQTARNSGLMTPPSDKILQFLAANNNFMAEQIQAAQSLKDNDPEKIYWRHVALILQQMEGIFEGYNDSPVGYSTPLSRTQILFLNLGGDMEDLGDLFSNQTTKQKAFEASHCSALIKLLNNNADLYVAQDTWSSLNSMLRIYKLYDFPWSINGSSNTTVPGVKSSFSSYPGSLFSGDDFYVLSSGLIVLETTIGFNNQDLKRFIQPSTVLEWMRNILANRLASNGSEWIIVYSKYNSGTYNNQNMVVDYKKFVPGRPLVNGTFYLVEQIPGYVISNDLSQLLQSQSYFGSYNTAYDKQVRNISGSDDLVRQFGSWFDYYNTPRALIFKREEPSITNMDQMKRVMRYNNFKNDPLSSQLPQCEFLHMTNCTPAYTAENTIACRDDLNPKDGVYAFDALGWRNHVATDSKITSFTMYNNHSVPCVAQSGPTYDQVPPFQFSKSDFNDVPHEGLPDLWNFPWVTVSW